MAALTPTTEYEGCVGDLKIKVVKVSVTSSSDTITFDDMTSVKFVHAYISGTEDTALDVTISNNVITTAGHSSGTEVWDMLVIGI